MVTITKSRINEIIREEVQKLTENAKTDKMYIEILTDVLGEKKVWERNDLLDAFKKQLKKK